MFIYFYFFNVYLFLRQRETEHEQGRVRERGIHRIWNRLQSLSHQPRARRGARTHRPRDRDLSWSWMLNRLSHPGAPICLFLRERETEQECGRGEREGDTESKGASRLGAVSTVVGLKPTNREIMTWAEVRRLNSWATQAPLTHHFINVVPLHPDLYGFFWEIHSHWSNYSLYLQCCFSVAVVEICFCAGIFSNMWINVDFFEIVQFGVCEFLETVD